MQTIKVRHNMEMAHRLSQTPGKCENIHGHSWWCTLSITGPVDSTGKVLEFGEVKQLFREHLDRNFDHRLVLGMHDDFVTTEIRRLIPGLHVVDFEPTTENIARNIYEWAKHLFPFTVGIELWETAVNCATIGDVNA